MSALSFLSAEDFNNFPRPRSSDGAEARPSMPKRPSAPRNFSFTAALRPSASRNVSFFSTKPDKPDKPDNTEDRAPSQRRQREFRAASPPRPKPREKTWLKLNRHERNVDPTLTPAPPPTPQANTQPFLIFSDAFSILLGPNPSLELIIHDPRAPYFYSGGTWISRINTLFLTSNLIRDSDPAAISSANRRTEITKIEFYSSSDFSRDKVRCPERSYMAAGVALYPNGENNGIVTCAQGSLKEPAGLVYIDVKRPHKTHMLINNFYGRPFNSPCNLAANLADASLWFTDPAYGYERGFRPKPQLPTGHLYRFDPESGDIRVVANGLTRPAGLAFSPDFRTLYVAELGEKYSNDGVTIYAYDVTYHNPLSSSTPSFEISIANHTKTPSNSTVSSNGTNNSNYSSRLTPANSPRRPDLRLDGEHGGSSSLFRSHSRSRSRNGTSAAPEPSIRSPTYAPTVHPQTAHSSNPSAAGPFLTGKRLFAYSHAAGSGGISTDPVYGNVCLGTEEGVEVWSPLTGELIGRILVGDHEDEVVGSEEKRRRPSKGVSKVCFGDDGETWLFGGERVWRVKMRGGEGVV